MPSGDKHAAIGQKSVAGTENVCTRFWSGGDHIARWIPELGVIAQLVRGPP
jgi:hypothetical protein